MRRKEIPPIVIGMILWVSSYVVMGMLFSPMGMFPLLGHGLELLPAGLLVGGIALVVWGCYLWARRKNRHGTWCLMGFLGPIGFIVLACLKDRA